MSRGKGTRPDLRERNLRHGLRYHRFYIVWKSMIARCYRHAHHRYKDYGGRGITVCDEWRDDPMAFLAWCDAQEIPDGYSLDREENNGNYNPSNCRFISQDDQRRNMRSNVFVEHNGETLCKTDFVKKYGLVSLRTVNRRIEKEGMDVKEAALTPSERKRK